jgi:Ligand-gated ion channel
MITLRKLFLIFCSLFLLSVSSQESPSIFVDKFDTSKLYRTNVCDRQKQIWNGSLEIKDALRGLNLTVLMTDTHYGNEEDEFFSLKDGKIQQPYPGLSAVILDEVAQRAGFQWRNSFAINAPLDPETDGNKTWTDILTWGIEVFDISGEVWGQSIERKALGVSFPTGWYDSSIILVEHVPPNQNKEVVNLWSFLAPFNFSVWISIWVFIALTSVVYSLLEYLDVNAKENDPPCSLSKNFYLASVAFSGHFSFKPTTNATRVLGLSWAFWVVIVVSAYTANMASFMVSQKVKIFRLSSIEDAVTQKLPICINQGTFIDSVLSNMYPDLNLVRMPSIADAFDEIKKDEKVSVCETLAYDMNSVRMYEHSKAVNPDCAVSSSKVSQVNMFSGMATAVDAGRFRCTSLISHVISYHVTEMISDGFVEDAWRTFIARFSTIECVPEPQRDKGGIQFDETFSLTLQDVGGIFVVHTCLSILAIAVAFFQYFYGKAGRKNQRVLLEIFGLQWIWNHIRKHDD